MSDGTETGDWVGMSFSALLKSRHLADCAGFPGAKVALNLGDLGSHGLEDAVARCTCGLERAIQAEEKARAVEVELRYQWLRGVVA